MDLGTLSKIRDCSEGGRPPPLSVRGVSKFPPLRLPGLIFLNMCERFRQFCEGLVGLLLL